MDAGLLDRWKTLVAGPEPDVFEGALLIAELVDPAEDAAAARRRVASLAGRVRAQASESRVQALRRVLFAEEGFRGDEESYDDPSNSSVARVLASHRGMPITLSIVAIEVGRLAGLRLTGVGLPGHFVVGGPDLPEGLYLDPFGAGALCDMAALSERLAAIFGAPVALGPDVLAPDSPRAILARVLANLRRSFERRGRQEEALAAAELSEALTGVVAAAIAPDAEGERSVPRRTFTLEEARGLLPRVQELTAQAVIRFGKMPASLEEERRAVVEEWARELESLGCEIKGLWLVDFDSGGGYYCWKYPEPALDHFHGYEEGFSGRLALQ